MLNTSLGFQPSATLRPSPRYVRLPPWQTAAYAHELRAGLLPRGGCSRRLCCPQPGPAPRPRPAREGVQAAASPPSVAAAAAAASSWEQPEEQQRVGFLAAAALAVRGHLAKLDGLWGKFVPMAGLFFLLAFVNTLGDSLKDSLVITAAGGGTHVIPYLTVYGVLPSSLLFLLLYSWGTQRFSRERLFNIVACSFISFYAVFGLLYPMHDTLHLHGLGDMLGKVLPSGLSGLVGMVRNWLFTLFYCASELWGDVMLSLLFWGLANETTSIEDAPLLYPLFGIGANVAQAVAGRVLRTLSMAAGGCKDAYSARVQAIMGLIVALGCGVLVLHAYISKHFPRNPKGSTAARVAAERAQRAAAAQQQHQQQQRPPGGSGGSGLSNGSSNGLANGSAASNGVANGLANGNGAFAAKVSSQMLQGGKLSGSGGVRFAGDGRGKAGVASIAKGPAAQLRQQEQQQPLHGCTPPSAADGGAAAVGHREEDGETHVPARRRQKKQKQAMSMRDAFDFLKHSPQIRCLAIMALAQGITCNLLDLNFKHHLHKLYSQPAAYSAFLGDTAMWTGIITGTLMFVSPLLFDRVGWKGVASATPNFMLYAGVPFFAGCVLYNFMAGPLVGAWVLKMLVIIGAVLQVVARGAKFSLFKPAEEMVYIGLDDESRTKGKAAIDVVGAQSGKSTGSILQQALLILSGGTLAGILPVLTLLYVFMLSQWKGAVGELADRYDPAHAHRMLSSMDMSDSELEEEQSGGEGSGAALAGAVLQPA